MSSPEAISPIGRYIEFIAGGPKVENKTIADAIKAANPGSRVAGSLVGRWKRGEVEVSVGNLAALARTYERSPLEAFVVADLLGEEEAAPGLDADSRKLLAKIRRDDLRARREAREASKVPGSQSKAARSRAGKRKLSDD